MAGLGLSAAIDRAFWRGRRVFLTGHTGFKGAWLALMLSRLGADVRGYSLAPTTPSLFALAGIEADIEGTIADVCDREALDAAVLSAQPEVVIHFAAEALVRRARREPARTFATNVAGTVNMFEALRAIEPPRVILVATTDKVYRNDETGRPFDENAALGGREPYGASKVAQEMVTRAYGDCYFEPNGGAVATARAGNVIGGGDFGEDRLIPDLVRAFEAGEVATIRDPSATRPWQHVLDCLSAYLLFIEKLACDRNAPRALNIGPRPAQLTVAAVADAVATAFGRQGLWRSGEGNGSTEAHSLALDPTLAERTLDWAPRFSGEQAIRETARWYSDAHFGRDIRQTSLAAIDDHLETKP